MALSKKERAELRESVKSGAYIQPKRRERVSVENRGVLSPKPAAGQSPAANPYTIPARPASLMNVTPYGTTSTGQPQTAFGALQQFTTPLADVDNFTAAEINAARPKLGEAVRTFQQENPLYEPTGLKKVAGKITDTQNKIRGVLGLGKVSEEKEFPSYYETMQRREQQTAPLENLIGGLASGATFGLTKKAEEALYGPSARAGYETGAGRTGELLGTLVQPGTKAITRGVGKLIPSTGKAATAIKGVLTGGALGATGQAGMETVDVGFGGDLDLGERAKRVGEAAAFGAGLGAAGEALIGGIKGLGRYAQKIAQETTMNSPQFRQVVSVLGEDGARAAVGKQNLADIDEQILAASRSSAPDKPAQVQSLFNERNAIINYVKQFEPDFEAPRPRMTAGKQNAVSLPEPPVTRADVADELSPAQGGRASIETTTVRPATVRPPQQAPAPGRRETIRSNFATQMESEGISQGVKREIAQLDHTYNPITNADTVAQADANITARGVDKSVNDYLSRETTEAVDIAEGYRLMQLLDARGDYKQAAKVAADVAEALTKAGQTAQAGIIIKKLSPEGRLLALTRKATESKKAVSEKDAQEFMQAAKEVQATAGAGQRANALDSVLDKLERGGKATEQDMELIQRYLDRAERFAPAKDIDLEKAFPAMKEPRKREKVISFLEKQEQAALERIAARKGRLNSLPFDEWADHAIVISTQVAKGLIKAETHVEDLVRRFGEEIRPHATRVFKQAQNLVGTVAQRAANNVEDLNRAFGRTQQDKEKAAVSAMAEHVKLVIDSAKRGELDPADVQKLRDYADEINEMVTGKKEITPEQRYLGNVKALATKIAEKQKTPGAVTDEATRELSLLVRKVAEDPSVPREQRVKVDVQTENALQSIADDLTGQTTKSRAQEKLLTEFLKKQPDVTADDIAKLRQLSKDIQQLEGKAGRDADVQLQQIMNKYGKSSIMDKINTIRYTAMLLNTQTQLVNVVGGLSQAGYMNTMDLLGAMIEKAFVKKDNRVTAAIGMNPGKYLAELFKNAKFGATANWKGVNPAGLQSATEKGGLTFSGKYNPLGVAERTLKAVAGGADYAIYKTQFSNEIRKQAKLAADRQGLKGTERNRFIQQFENDPPAEAQEIADQIGRRSTFQNRKGAGTIASELLKGRKTADSKTEKFITRAAEEGVRAVVPFVRTVGNLAEEAANYTPAGLLRGLAELKYAKTPAARRQALQTFGLSAGGTALGVGGFTLAALNLLTDANDSGDKNVDAIREQAGEGRYKLNIDGAGRVLGAITSGEGWEAAKKAGQYQEGDSQIDLPRLLPLSFTGTLGAAVQGSRERGDSLAGSAKNVGLQALSDIVKMTPLQTVQQQFQQGYGGGETAGQKQAGWFEQQAENYAKSFSPSLLGQTARIEDPLQRETAYKKGFVPDVTDYYKSRMPSLGGLIPEKYTSKSLEPRLTTLGWERENAPGVLGQLLNPLKYEKAPYNKAAKTISELIDRTGDTSIAPSEPSQKIKGTDAKTGEKNVTKEIPAKRYTRYKADIGQEITTKVNALGSMSDEKKVEAIAKIISDTEKKYRDRIKKELGIRVSS